MKEQETTKNEHRGLKNLHRVSRNKKERVIEIKNTRV